MEKEQTMKCKWCGEDTPMFGTKMCNRCWELDGRIRCDLQLAKRMLTYYSKQETK